MRPALIGLTLLAASNVAHAEFIWNVMQSNSVGVSNFRYVAPGSGDEFIIDLNGYFNYNGTATFADPVEQPDGHWRSETLDFDITYQDVSGTYYRATPAAGPNGFTLTDPARSQPDQQIISASQIDISLPGNPGNVVATDFVPQHSGLDFILYNTPDLRDPADLPHDPAVDNFLTVLVENLACGVSGCAGPGFAYTSEDWLSDTLASSPDLPSDWTALSLQVKSFDFDIVVDDAFLTTVSNRIGFALDPLGIQGLSDNNDGTFTLTTQNQQALTWYTTDPFAEFLENPAAPGDINNPLLPQPDPICGGFCFEFEVEDPNTFTFIDPEIATGYVYEILGDGFFTSVLLPAIGDGLFDLFLWDDLLGDYVDSGIDLTAGLVHNFGSGINRFMIDGIELSAGLDPSDPLAFITGLTFDRAGQISVSQTAISTFVPEPGVLALLATGLCGAWFVRRRDKAEARRAYS